MDTPKSDYFEDLVQHLFLDIDYESAALAGSQSPLLGGDDLLSSPKSLPPIEYAKPTTTTSSSTSITTSNSDVQRFPLKVQSSWSSALKGPAPAPAPVPLPTISSKTLLAPAPAPIALPTIIKSNKRSRTSTQVETNSLGDTDDLFAFSFDANAFQNDNMKAAAEYAPHPKKPKTQSTDYKGVCFHPSYGRYRARIKINGKTTHLGYFETAYQAAIAYDRAAHELRGNSAVTNFPIENYTLSSDVPNSPRSRCLAAARSAIEVTAPQSQVTL